jgi:hypothetical protein
MSLNVGIELDEAGEAALRALAERESTDAAGLVRRAVIEYLARHQADDMVDRASRMFAELDAPILGRL